MITLVATLSAGFALYAWWPSTALREPIVGKMTFPKGSEGQENLYEPIGSGCFALKRIMPKPELPDLRAELIYLGPNGRPDSKDAGLYLTAKGSSIPVTVAVDQLQYLALTSEGFAFSGEPTHLWITPRSVKGNGLEAEVGMETPEGERVDTPQERMRILLPEQEGKKIPVWQMGELRVDASLLARQRARWFGEDRFLTEHGGEEYGHAAGRERIDFGEGNASYSCFIRIGEGLIWNGERWTASPLGETSRSYPLLILNKREERSLHFELWDEAGRMKTPVTLMRSKDGWLPNHLKEALRFVAAKTWSQFVLEWGQERLQVRPGDWLLLDKEGIRVLGSAEEILEYAAGRVTGELLVIEGLTRNEGKHLLQGHLFNTSRSDRIPFEIPLTLELRPGAYAPPQIARRVPSPPEDPGAPVTIRIPRSSPEGPL